MKIDGAILVDDPVEAGPRARQLETDGYDGGFTFEGRHDPFLPLLAAAQATRHLELATAIAIAFARNPMTLANLGYDLQLASRGRFILGLGTQIRPHIERRFSATWSQPAARMRELVLAVRAIWEAWQERTRLDFRGEFYTHTLMTPFFDPGPNPFGTPRLFCAGVGPRMTEVVGEVADGFFVHPFHTVESLRRLTLPALERGLARGGRRREDFEISCQVIVAAGATERELAEAAAGARAQIAFYGSTPAYRPVLECHGGGELQEELNRLSKRGQWAEMSERVNEDLLHAVAVVDHPDRIAGRLRERCAGFADRVSLVTYGLDAEGSAALVRALRAD